MDDRDRIELTDLVSRLGACIDEHRFADLHALFVADATISTPGGTSSGADAVVVQARRNHEGYVAHQHAITNVLVELDGDSATMRANVLSAWVREGTGPEFALGGVYRFGARRTEQGWRFSHLEVRQVWRTAALAAPAA